MSEKTIVRNKSRSRRNRAIILRPISDKSVYCFTRIHTLREGIYDWSAPENFAISFQLSDLTSYSEFVSLFDQYRIDKLDLKFIYSQSNAPVPIPAANIACMPLMYHVIDYNDSTALSIPEEYQQYQNCVVANIDRFPTISFRPKLATAIYNGTFSGYGSTALWVDTNTAGARYYGSKFTVDPLNTNTGSNILGYLTIVITYHLSFRHVK